MLSRLGELTINSTVDSFQTLVLYQSVLLDIILNSKQILRLCFRDIVIEEKNYVNDKIGDSVRTLINNADHIKEWSLINAYATYFGFSLCQDMLGHRSLKIAVALILEIAVMIILRNWYWKV